MPAPSDDPYERPKSNTGRTIAIVWLIIVGVLGLLAVSLFALRRGTASRSDGEAAIARVERAPDGDCLVGGSREHCFGLELTVFPKRGEAFRAKLDVNVPDRWASRVQPGSYVWVVRDRENPREVALDLGAFAEPAPKPEPKPEAP